MVALKAMGGLCPLLALVALLPLLTITPLAASDDSSSTSVTEIPDCPGRVVLFQLDSFRWKAKISDSKSPDSFLLEVIGNSSCDDGFPPIMIPLVDVSLVYTNAEATLTNVIGHGSFTTPTITLNFTIDINTIDFDEEVYYVVFASVGTETSAGNEWERSAENRWQTYQMNGEAKFAMTVKPGVIQGHYLKALNLTRLMGLTQIVNASLDNCEPAPLDEDACYFLQPELGEPAACVRKPRAQTDGDGSILICDDTVQPVTVSETTNLDRVQLLYESREVAVTQTNRTTTLELYYFSDGTYEACEDAPAVYGSTNCSLAGFELSLESYTFRMVELERSGGSPTSSREVLVQDFNVSTRGISSDTVQVFWDSNNSNEFNVAISPAPDATFSGRVVNCTESPCNSFFIGLQEIWTDYRTVVRSLVSDDFGPEVVAPLEAPPENITPDMHNITRLNHYKHEILHTEACFEYDSDEPNNARLLIIDSTGLFVQSVVGDITLVGDMQDNNPTYCFESVDVPLEFITSDQTRILIDFEANNTIFSTQMDIFLFTPDIQQVSNTSARVTWQNLNSAEFTTSRAPGFENHQGSQQLECSYAGDQCYYYVNEDQAGSGNFSLLETSEKLQQNSTVGLQMKKIPAGLHIVTPFSIRNDDKLRVCFDAVPNADRYELGIELLGELVSSDQDAPIQMDSGKTCAISRNPVTLGAYEELWGVVVAYDTNGTILSAEEKLYEDMFLSPNRFVLAVTKGSTIPVTLKTSWYIIDDTKGLEIYDTNLVNENGATLEHTSVTMPKTTLDIIINEQGLYTVCVSVTSPIGTPSEQTCSDIITVKFDTDLPDLAPMVTNVHQFYTSDQNLKLSWDRPEDATAVLVSWSRDSSTHSADNRRALRSMETAKNPALTLRKTEARQSFRHGSDAAAFSSQKADVPLSQARSLQNINDQIRRVTLPTITGDGFTLVPASQSSLDIPLAEGTWNICVSAVKNHMGGEDNCLNVTFDATVIHVSPPTGLTFIEGMLNWTAPADTTDGVDYTYYIEFGMDAESVSLTWNDTILPVADFVEAGQWNVAVHSVTTSATDSMYLSKGLSTVIVVNGIKVTYKQTGSRSVTLSWEETTQSSEEEELKYSVTLVGVQSVNTTCSRATGCSVTFDDVQAAEEEKLNVTVERQNNEGTTEELQIFFLNISSVDANHLYRKINANGSATVTWQCLENVSFYNVSLVDPNGSVLRYVKQIMPCSYTFSESTLPTLEEDFVLVQACLNSPGVVRCGDPQRVNLAPDVPEPTTDTSNVLVIVLSSVAAGLLVILMVAGIVFKFRSDRAKRPAEDATSTGGGSVHSLKSNSGSQCSVEPPAGQPRTALQANAANSPSAQNPSQPPVQRQTPVQYLSAAPATGFAQTQPLNRPIELSLRARQYPEVARAPISSVNPNVRYDGPVQRNAPSNPGPQRFPQVAYPPAQRFSAPGQAANPNIRASGPVRMNVPAGQPRMNNVPAGQPRMNNVPAGQPRMNNVPAGQPRMNNVPAGQPRMNNVPSGPTYYSGQPRNLSQSARMNRPPGSQPIEVPGRFSRPPIAARPTHLSPSRAQARPTGLQMSAAPARYPPPGQRSGPGPSSPTRPQTAPSGPRPIPRVGGGGGGGYAGLGPSPPGVRQTRSDVRQFSPERSVRQPQPQDPRSQVRNVNGPNYNERFF